MTLNLQREEEDYFKARRAAVGEVEGIVLTEHATALALSGGGIRSATLSLGVLAALSKHGLVHQFDFLSTVSGGGYTGGFYGSMFVPPRARAAPVKGWRKPVETKDPLGTEFGRAAIRHLRENGRYLLDDAGDTLRLMIVAVRGWIAVQIVIGISLLALFLLAKWGQAWLANMQAVQDFDLKLALKGVPTIFWPGEWLRGYPLGDTIALSWLWPPSIIFLAAAIMSGWSFWLTRLTRVPRSRVRRITNWGFLGTCLVALACAIWPLAIGRHCIANKSEGTQCLLSPEVTGPLYYASIIIGILAAGSLFFYIIAEIARGRVHPGGNAGSDSPSAQEGRVRTRLTSYAHWWVQIAIIFALFALIDTMAQTLYRGWLWSGHRGVPLPVVGPALVAAGTPFVRSIIEWVQTSGPTGPRLRRYGRQIALVLALTLLLILGTFWATLAEYIAWRSGPIGGGNALPITEAKAVHWSMASVAIPAIGFSLAAAAIGMSAGFLNLSTFGAFYASRLRRAYLGASNPLRASAGSDQKIEIDDPGDDISLEAYFASDTGAPLHIINVTLNQTTGRNGSSLVQRDRKGLPLTVSPAGFLVDGKAIGQ